MRELTRRLATLTIALCAYQALPLAAQTGAEPVTRTVTINGQELQVMVTPEGDTLLIATALTEASVSSPRRFESEEDRKLYRKYRYYAAKAYPYAVEAIRIFRETEEVTATMKPREARRHIRRLQKELKKEFEEPLKKLTKTQGYLLVKMIERDTGRPMYDLIKDLRNGVTATYWQTMGKLVGYDLKAGYVPGADPILDVVLGDYNVSHGPAVSAADTLEVSERRPRG